MEGHRGESGQTCKSRPCFASSVFKAVKQIQLTYGIGLRAVCERAFRWESLNFKITVCIFPV